MWREIVIFNNIKICERVIFLKNISVYLGLFMIFVYKSFLSGNKIIISV